MCFLPFSSSRRRWPTVWRPSPQMSVARHPRHRAGRSAPQQGASECRTRGARPGSASLERSGRTTRVGPLGLLTQSASGLPGLCWPLRPSVPRTPVRAASRDTIAAASWAAPPGLLQSSAVGGGCGGRPLVRRADESNGQHTLLALIQRRGGSGTVESDDIADAHAAHALGVAYSPVHMSRRCTISRSTAGSWVAVWGSRLTIMQRLSRRLILRWAVRAAWLIRPVLQGFEPSTSMFRSSRVL